MADSPIRPTPPLLRVCVVCMDSDAPEIPYSNALRDMDVRRLLSDGEPVDLADGYTLSYTLDYLADRDGGMTEFWCIVPQLPSMNRVSFERTDFLERVMRPAAVSSRIPVRYTPDSEVQRFVNASMPGMEAGLGRLDIYPVRDRQNVDRFFQDTHTSGLTHGGAAVLRLFRILLLENADSLYGVRHHAVA